MSYRASDGRSAVWPPPIYVATLANGAVVRMSFYSRRGKPLDFERGRRVCEGLAWTAAEALAGGVPRRPILAGYVEVDGAVQFDPHFNTKAAAAKIVAFKPARAEVSPLAALLRRAADVCTSDRAMALQLVLQAQADLDPVPAFNEPHPASIPVHYPKAWRR